jgi:Protein of unknown function (DUF3099)
VADGPEPEGPLEPPLGEPGRGRKRAYFWLMGLCLLLIALSWGLVRLWSVPAAVAMSLVAAVIPPTAAIVANWGRGG